jgi:dihydropteroate synthase
MKHPSGLRPELAHLDRALVWGVLNVTPDSFSDGGRWLDPAAAVVQGLLLQATGADVVDVGGESTRPGAQRVTVDEELARVLPVVSALAAAGVVVSIDTMRPAVAAAAVGAGAGLVNDVSGGLADPGMLDLLADLTVPYVAMHWRGHSADMEALATYDDVVADVARELEARLAAAVAAGIREDRVVLDPGLGFAKHSDHNWALLSHLGVLAGLGRPLLVGASRKRFLGTLLAAPDGEPRPMDERDDATDAVSALAAAAGAWGVRVHDVAGSLDAVIVARAWQRAGAGHSDDAGGKP